MCCGNIYQMQDFTPEEYDCVQELNAFARGGEYAMQLLQKVYANIFKHYGISNDRVHDILRAASLYADADYNIKTRLP
jgi:hypothetical protein